MVVAPDVLGQVERQALAPNAALGGQPALEVAPEAFQAVDVPLAAPIRAGTVVHEPVFRRFGTEKEKAKGLEFLSDNGPEYICERLRAVLQGFGIIVCHTPRRSPESNGLAEAFFGTFKRDYVYQGELESLEEIGRNLPGWIQDYNEVAPHSALGMKAPVQFYVDWIASKINKSPVQN